MILETSRDSVCEKEQISGGEDRLVGSEQTCRVVVVEFGVTETPISGEFMLCPDYTGVVPEVALLLTDRRIDGLTDRGVTKATDWIWFLARLSSSRWTPVTMQVPEGRPAT
ncbi:hypothetical protein TREMEDRAFT_64614 [Tremella mesenterica DSM 1558]|uniref:uncharacterized protein n=1 Tax=Tremella mesenterica (strain ATCC 24925 / CBS 8224 / DSM 1558 / NBRC 9311 / NRRL Y-6157 / RJB 2259-6 / UBC 559-6) TaxID=578456 RepID=UPI0003F48EC9|nr:uncharacterized protein TREMEDRAFT_64614 [Tremella mesenterica DSM 1558]EIW67362.1 hypothetical protein TREMEDRAFT_64614 [Tremella mesenterica DSM 1558]